MKIGQIVRNPLKPGICIVKEGVSNNGVKFLYLEFVKDYGNNETVNIYGKDLDED